MLVITLDVDGAPDWMIDHCAGVLAARGVPATWFCGHATPALGRLRARPELFELGIAPNMLPNSPQGTTRAEVLRYAMSLVPEARCSRFQGCLQSTALLAELVARTPVRIDSTTFLPETELQVVSELTPAGELARVPFTWSDEYEPLRPGADWDVRRYRSGVLAFHPVRVCLDLATPSEYAAARSYVGSSRATDLAPADRPGPARAFARIVDHLARAGTARRLCDVVLTER